MSYDQIREQADVEDGLYAAAMRRLVAGWRRWRRDIGHRDSGGWHQLRKPPSEVIGVAVVIGSGHGWVLQTVIGSQAPCPASADWPRFAARAEGVR
jgi:hypothetical protein